MTLDIAAIKARAEKATKGPWFAKGRYIGPSSHMSYVGECRDQNGNWSDEGMASENASFIAHARTDIPELIDALEASEAARVKAEMERDKAKQDADLCAEQWIGSLEESNTLRANWKDCLTRITALEAERYALKEALKMPDADRRQWLLSELVATKGYFNRVDLCEAFGISIPQASTDIRRFLTVFPGLVEYDKTAKRYSRRALEAKP